MKAHKIFFISMFLGLLWTACQQKNTITPNDNKTVDRKQDETATRPSITDETFKEKLVSIPDSVNNAQSLQTFGKFLFTAFRQKDYKLLMPKLATYDEYSLFLNTLFENGSAFVGYTDLLEAEKFYGNYLTTNRRSFDLMLKYGEERGVVWEEAKLGSIDIKLMNYEGFIMGNIWMYFIHNNDRFRLKIKYSAKSRTEENTWKMGEEFKMSMMQPGQNP